MDYCLTFICCKMVSLSLKRPGMSHQKFFIAIAHNAEIKVTDWMFQVTWLVSSNQRASFQRRVDMLPLYAFMTSGPGIGHKKVLHSCWISLLLEVCRRRKKFFLSSSPSSTLLLSSSSLAKAKALATREASTCYTFSVNTLIKYFKLVIYDSRVLLTRKLRP